jgi:phage gp36-like protein
MYITTQDFLNLYDIEEFSSVFRTRIDMLVANANALIDNTLAPANRYVLPFNPIPEEIKQIIMDIARYHVMGEAKIWTSVYDGKWLDDLRKRYEDALALLEKIRNGEYLLAAPLIPDSGRIRYYTQDRVFTPLILDSY